jgi:hypothetical protein
MPSSAAKFSTDYLSKDQMRDALLALPVALLSLLGEHKIVVSYGWAAHIHGDLMYKPMHEDTRWVQYLVEDSIAQKIIVPGESDFYFDVPENRLNVTFCHESDIHLDGSDDELLQRFMSSEPYCRFRWNTREDVEKIMS